MDGPFPAILVLNGSEGALSGWSHRPAVLFAAHGFLAYPHLYSTDGNAWNAGAIKNVAIDRTEQALIALRKFEFSADKVALYAVSRVPFWQIDGYVLTPNSADRFSNNLQE